ncbi:hypothetical protein [Sodalis sp. dw_96]|uniref:hypothetical protein n=1 Tax=Sodalis sp. dw_96 TaxID=2719794 RepID=UPI001BD62BD9|nr:hypothetical protein [Sodalis sp. dw_96]
MSETNIERIQPVKPQRDENGWWSHPDYIPDLEEDALRVEFDVWLEVNGVECVARLMEDDLEPGSPEAVAWESLDCDCSAWNPKPPEGTGWFLVSVHDTEDGPSAVWLRKLPDAQPITSYDALVRFYRKLHDEHRALDGETQRLRHRCDYLDRKLEELKTTRRAPMPAPKVCTCIKCGCNDDHACVNENDTPCHWVKVDRAAGTGICSQCAPEWVEKLAEDM